MLGGGSVSPSAGGEVTGATSPNVDCPGGGVINGAAAAGVGLMDLAVLVRSALLFLPPHHRNSLNDSRFSVHELGIGVYKRG